MDVTADASQLNTYQQGLDLLREGRVEEGLALLETLVAAMPKALADIAYARYVRREIPQAEQYLVRYLEAFPDDSGAWALRSKIARERNDLPSAVRHARRAVELLPDSALRWFELGEILYHSRNWKEAARAYRRCLRLDPEFARARVRLDAVMQLGGINRIRAITWSRPVSAVLRRVLASDLFADLIELDMGITLDDVRWRLPLEGEAGAAAEIEPPAGREPERFPTHMQQCRCGFWHWFRAQPIEGRVESILEIGFGTGHVAHHFAAAGMRVISVTPHEWARRDRDRRGIEAFRADPHFIPERGNAFDLLVCPFAIERSRSPLFALNEWKRLLRPDGYLLLLAQLFCADPAHRLPSDVIWPPTYWQLRWLLRQTGFQLMGETLEDPQTGQLAGVERVDGRREPNPDRLWNVFFLLRKPGTLPYDGALEKPRVA